MIRALGLVIFYILNAMMQINQKNLGIGMMTMSLMILGIFAITSLQPIAESFGIGSDNGKIIQYPIVFHSSENNKLSLPFIAAGEQVMVTTNLTNSEYQVQPFVVVFEIRDSNDITISLQLHKGMLEPLSHTDLEMPITLNNLGKYVARTFVINGVDKPEILSTVDESTFNVVEPGSIDQFGIKKIYPTKLGGREWYMNMNDPFDDVNFMPTGDPFDKQDSSFLIKRPDGSWETTDEKSRILIGGTPEFRNIEMTGYVKLISAKDPDFDSFTWYARGGLHWEDSPCNGTALRGAVRYDGGFTSFAKELWHGGGDIGYTDKAGTIKNATSPLFRRWVGIKFMVYNIDNDTHTKMELWLDDKDNNQWKKISEYVDDGNWYIHNSSPGCLNPLTGSPIKDNDIILWSGQYVTFRSDNNIFDFKDLSVREIQAN